MAAVIAQWHQMDDATRLLHFQRVLHDASHYYALCASMWWGVHAPPPPPPPPCEEPLESPPPMTTDSDAPLGDVIDELRAASIFGARFGEDFWYL